MGLNTGALYIIIILFLLFGLAYLATGPSPSQSPILTGTEVAVNDAIPEQAQDKLQLLTFDGATITPPAGSVCQPGGINARPEIIIGYSPSHGTAVPSDGLIQLWATDTGHLLVAPAARISHNSGRVLAPGDTTQLAPDGHRIAPSLYVFPQTADNQGQPYFPTIIKGDYNNGRSQVARGRDAVPYDGKPSEKYVLQYIWKIQDIGLTPGAYQLQFVVSDAQAAHGVACISIRVYEPANPRYAIPD